MEPATSDFRLRLGPVFARQKRNWLAQKSVPRVALPAEVERALGTITDAGFGSPAGKRSIWLSLLRANGRLLLKAIAAALVMALCAASSTLAAIRILKLEHGLTGMIGLAFLYFGLNCLVQVASYFNGRVRGWVGLVTQAHLVGMISRKLLRLSSTAALKQSSGNLKVLATSDVSHVGQFLENAVRNLIPSVVTVCVVIPFLLRLSGTSGLVGIAVMAALLPISVGLNAISQRFQDRGQAELDRLASLVGEWVKNIRLVRYLSWEEGFERDVSERLRRYMRHSVATHFMACLIFGLSVSWWMVSVTAVVLISRWQGAELDLVGFFGSLWLLTFLAGYFTHLPNTIRLYGLAAPSVERIARLLAEEEQSEGLSPGEALPSGARPVRMLFEKVSYRFPGGKEAIRELDAEIDLGRKIAVIGEVGAGKSTFLKLLLGELKPTAGRIVVEFESGEKRDLWTAPVHPVVREGMAYVPQDPFVSSDRFALNITLGWEPEGDSGERAVTDAAYWAELEADLALFEQGIQQEIGESGVNLSGGQRQRLSLARAQHSGREFLVLDDTLSAVDTRTEARIMERLVSRRGGFVLVTHRTGELNRVEEVHVLSQGKFVEAGSPAELARDPDSHYSRVLRAYGSEEGGADG